MRTLVFVAVVAILCATASAWMGAQTLMNNTGNVDVMIQVQPFIDLDCPAQMWLTENDPVNNPNRYMGTAYLDLVNNVQCHVDATMTPTALVAGTSFECAMTGLAPMPGTPSTAWAPAVTLDPVDPTVDQWSPWTIALEARITDVGFSTAGPGPIKAADIEVVVTPN